MAAPLLYFGAAALAAWLASRRNVGKGTPPAAPLGGGPATGPVSTISTSGDVAGDVDNSEEDILLKDLYCFRNGQMGQLSPDAFFRQLWLPAARVRLSEISPYHWRLAMGLLNGGLHRRNDLEQLTIDFIAEQTQKQQAELGWSIIGKIISIVPVVGSVLSTVISSQVSDVANAAAGDLSGASMLASLRVAVDPKNLDPPAQMLISPSWMNGESTWDLSVIPWVARQGYAIQVPDMGRWVPDAYQKLVMPSYTYRKPFVIQRRLFACHEYGFLLPWISDELLGSDLRSTINIRARVYKALVTLSCLAFPDSDMSRRGLFGYYYYVNPKGGPIMGSIFPPTDEDLPLDKNTSYVGQAADWPGLWPNGKPGVPVTIDQLTPAQQAQLAANAQAQGLNQVPTENDTFAKYAANLPPNQAPSPTPIRRVVSGSDDIGVRGKVVGSPRRGPLIQ